MSRLRDRWAGLALLVLLGLLLAGCATGARTGNPASYPGVSANDSFAFVAHGDGVYAINLDTGVQARRYPLEAKPNLSFYAAPAISDDGLLYAGSYEKSVFAFDIATGTPVESFAPPALNGRVIGSPVVSGDLLLVPTDGGTLYALDRHSGEQKWSFKAVTESCGSSTGDPACLMWSAPLVDGDAAYVATLSHVLYAIDLASGKQRWASDLGAAIADTPTLDNGLLLTGVLGDSLVTVQSQDGRAGQPFPTSGWLWGSPVVQDGIAYFGDAMTTFLTTREGSGHVYAIDIRSQQPAWPTIPTGAVSTSPVIADGRLIVAFENGQVVAYDPANGSVLWQALAGGPIQGDPVVADGKILIGVNSTKTVLQAFDSSAGALLWTYPAASER